MTPRYEAPSRSITGTDANLLDQLRHADGRPYGFYKNALGAWDYGDFTLAIDHVQADPYAPPSSLRAWARPEAMGLPDAALASSDARLAAADFIARSFDEAIRARGTRDVTIARAGALILQRSYATVLPDRVEVRFQVKLPARGRTILGRSAAVRLLAVLVDVGIALHDLVQRLGVVFEMAAIGAEQQMQPNSQPFCQRERIVLVLGFGNQPGHAQAFPVVGGFVLHAA